ncbi:acyl-CoA thioesterase [Listeria grandensis]|uniref:Acyl-CoA thioesterase n=2 Tax=Listeria grandensis TaxID=1494963 RepID=A0A7X0Y1V4_9LIST|nr:acyl-CoA thioesterase [Listeria grandensis]MBC1935465.1 acyl-CoA thioesterase [Listeria grandensis]
MTERMQKFCKDSLVIKTSRVFPSDTNNHNTLFGGRLMTYIDDTASISASRHCRTGIVTASTDSVDFLQPIKNDHSVCLESYVASTGRSSMEIFVKVIAENLKTGDRYLAATSFLTFVAIDDNGKTVEVPTVVAQSDEERMISCDAKERSLARKKRLTQSRELAASLSTEIPWG